MIKYSILACIFLGTLLLGGCGGRNDLPTQQQLFVLQTQYGQGRQDFLTGHYERAFELLLPPAQHCYPAAEYAVGYMYFYGKGIVVDIDMAQYWMRRAAEHGYPAAPTALAKIDRIVAMQQQPFSLPAPNIQLEALEKKNKDYQDYENY